MHQVIIVTLWTLVVVITVAAIGLGVIVLSAWYEVRRQPKKPMHFCQTHGPLTDGQTMTFLDQQYCFQCWSNKVNDARRNHA